MEAGRRKRGGGWATNNVRTARQPARDPQHRVGLEVGARLSAVASVCGEGRVVHTRRPSKVEPLSISSLADVDDDNGDISSSSSRARELERHDTTLAALSPASLISCSRDRARARSARTASTSTIDDMSSAARPWCWSSARPTSDCSAANRKTPSCDARGRPRVQPSNRARDRSGGRVGQRRPCEARGNRATQPATGQEGESEEDNPARREQPSPRPVKTAHRKKTPSRDTRVRTTRRSGGAERAARKPTRGRGWSRDGEASFLFVRRRAARETPPLATERDLLTRRRDGGGDAPGPSRARG